MRRSLVARCTVLLGLMCTTARVVLAAAPPSGANSSPAGDSEDLVKSKFTAALKLHKAGKFDEALPLFRELVQMTGSPNARLYVALCLEQLGKNVEAYKEMLQTMKDAGARGEAKYEQTRGAADGELAVLNVRIAKLIVTLGQQPPGLAITVDGAPIDPRDIGGSLLLEPGTHKVEASATNQPTITREVRLDVGETRTVTLAFGKTDTPVSGELASHPAPVPAADSAPSDASPSPPSNTMKIAAYGALGVGGAGLLVFTVAGLIAKGKYSSLQDACHDGRCTDPGYANDVDAGKSAQKVANVGLVLGILGGAAGGGLLLLGARQHDASSARVSATPLPGGAYAAYGLHF